MIYKIQAIIGGVKFGVRTCPITHLSINNHIVWAVSHALMNKELHQYIDQGGCKVNFKGDVNLVKNGSMFYLDKLKEPQQMGTPLIITLGNGYVFPGKYVIDDINVSFDRMLDDGKARKKQWEIKLTQFGAF